MREGGGKNGVGEEKAKGRRKPIEKEEIVGVGEGEGLEEGEMRII